MGKYDLDLHAWAHEQADAARRRSANEIDWDNVAEELESLGKQVAAELRNRYIVLLAHLLKWRYQPERRSPSWRAIIAEQRRQIADHLEDNPSLKSVDQFEFERAYRTARIRASGETELDEAVFPVDPPFTPEQARAETSGPRASESELQQDKTSAPPSFSALVSSSRPERRDPGGDGAQALAAPGSRISPGGLCPG